VSASLDASGKALKDLRDELSKSGSTLLKDAQLRNVEKFVKDAGSGFRAVSKQLAKDLERVQKAASTGRKTTKRKSSGTKKKKSTAKRKSSSSARRGSSTAKRAASSAKKTAKSGAKRTKAAAKGAKSGAKRGSAGAKKRR
jgi:hypothetical protein